MNLLHGAYVFVCASGVIYFFKRKTIDPMLLGFGSTLIYFLPAILGVIGFSYGAGEGEYHSAVEPTVYLVMLIVIVFLMAGTYISDKICPQKSIITVHPYFSKGLLVLAVAGALISLQTVGKGYLCQEKSDVLVRLNIWYYVAAYSASSAVVVSFNERNWFVFSIAVFFVLLDVLLGFRGAAAMATCGTLMLYGRNFFKSTHKIRDVAIVLAFGLAFFAYKQLAWNVKYIFSVPCPAISPLDNTDTESHKVIAPIIFRVSQVKEVARLAVSENTVVSAFSNSEPMVTQAVLNEVVKRDFKTPSGYVVDQILSALPGAKSIFGIDARQIPSFNAFFQSSLFPKAKFGMANNPWAQAYAAGGLAMVTVFAFGYAFGLGILTFIYRNSQKGIQGTAAILSAWWGFYAHRNDLLVQFGIMKMVVYILVCSWALSYGLDLAKSRFSRLSLEPQG